MDVLYKIFLCGLFCCIMWIVGLVWFIGQIPTSPSGYAKQADAIVVLTGGRNRLEYGLELLAEGKGKRLFISGVHDNVSVAQLITNHTSPEVQHQLAGLPIDTVMLGHEAENTIGNAEETKDWLELEHYKSMRLVTSNYHMPRAMIEFDSVINGVVIIPDPVIPDNFSMDNWWLIQEGRSVMLSEYHKYLASIARHFFMSLIHRNV